MIFHIYYIICYIESAYIESCGMYKIMACLSKKLKNDTKFCFLAILSFSQQIRLNELISFLKKKKINRLNIFAEKCLAVCDKSLSRIY